MPRTTGRAVNAASQDTAPVIARASQKNPVTIADTKIARGDRFGVRDGHRRNRFHRLDRHRCPKVQARHNGQKAEAKKHALWVEAIDRDVADDERDKGAEVPEGPCKLRAVELVAGEIHKAGP